MPTTTRRPIWTGLISAALAGPICFLISMAVVAIRDPSPFDPKLFALFAFATLIYGLCVSILPTTLVGLPYILWLQKRERLSWGLVCLGAVGAGALAMAMIWWLAYQSYKPLAVFAAIGAGCGLASGLAFCAVVQPKRATVA
jgi:uncharacterized membrane protein